VTRATIPVADVEGWWGRYVPGVDEEARYGPSAPWRGSVVRPRLVDRLQPRFTVPVTVVVASAGFGKTTLLHQAFGAGRESSGGVDRWLTCVPEDVAASSLAAGLCRAVGAARPPGGHADRAIAAVVDAIVHEAPREVALILDDVHELPPGSPAAALLAGLVAALPRNGHVVLVGREPPPVALARLDVQGKVLRLGEADLAFSEAELTEFATARHVPVARLERCGGWPALAELIVSADPGVEDAFVWEEVLAAIEPGRRADLARLAHVGPFDEELAAEVLGHDVDLAALTVDLPLVATSTTTGTPSHAVHDIHQLWRPHLARVVPTAAIDEGRRRAGVVLARRGDIARAVRLLTEARAWDDLTRAVAVALGAEHPPVPGDVVATWLGRLPADRAETPLARLLDAVSAVESDPKTAAERLEVAVEAFRADDDLVGELACMAQLTQLAWWSERPDRVVGLAARLFEMHGQGFEPAAPLVHLARALAADLFNDAETTLAELDQIRPTALNAAWTSLVEWFRSTSLNHLGRAAEALAAAERACALASPVHVAVMGSARLQALWFLGQVDEALRELPALVERTATTGLRHYTALMAASCATLLAADGRAPEAAPHLEQARFAAGSRDVALVDVNVAIAEATLQVLAGDEAAAADVLQGYLTRVPGIAVGLAAYPQQRSLALWYLLVPESRAVWDRSRLGGTFDTGRRLARDLLALREQGRLPRAATTLPSPGVVRSLLPLPWAVDLALVHTTGGRSAGWAVLDALWPRARPHVERRAQGDDRALAPPARQALARLPVPPTGRLELGVLGPVELRRDGVLVDSPDWRRAPVRELLTHLAVHPPVSRERLAEDLWGERVGGTATSNLRVALSQLLGVLEPDRPGRAASFFVRPHADGLRLHRGEGEHLDADVWRFDAARQRAVELDRDGRSSEALTHLRAAVALWRGDPGAWAHAPWAVAEVEERRGGLVALACRAGELLLAGGEPEEARRMGETALRHDPWSRRAVDVVVGAASDLGDLGGVRRALDRYRAALLDLGLAEADVDRQLADLERRTPG